MTGVLTMQEDTSVVKQPDSSSPVEVSKASLLSMDAQSLGLQLPGKYKDLPTAMLYPSVISSAANGECRWGCSGAKVDLVRRQHTCVILLCSMLCLVIPLIL